MLLADQVALLTGGGSGIGRAAALRFAEEGATVAVVDRNPAAVDETIALVKGAGGRAVGIVADLTDPAAVEAAFIEADCLGGLTILYNCVGGSFAADGTVEELTVDVIDDVIALELRTAILCSGQGVPRLRAAGGGSIINMTSYVATRGGSSIHAYAAAKGAVTSLTRSMAGTYAADGIRVNAVAPGIALTDRARERMKDPKVAGHVKFSWDDYPFAMGDPVDIANVALFLASPMSRMITGHVVMADGGLTAY